jgi:large subunit ribosomal protein L24
VKIIAGKFKGQTGKVLGVNQKAKTVQVENIGIVTRHIKPNQLNPRGGEKQVHVGLDVSKVARIDAAKPAAKPAKTTKKETK